MKDLAVDGESMVRKMCGGGSWTEGGVRRSREGVVVGGWISIEMATVERLKRFEAWRRDGVCVVLKMNNSGLRRVGWCL